MDPRGVVTLASRKRWAVGAGVVALAAVASVGVIATSQGVSATTSDNLVRDPEFATGTASWTTTTGASLSIADGHDGHLAIQLLNQTANPGTFALNDRVNTVSTTRAGATYQAGAWVRTDSPGLTAGARMMEYQGSVLHGSQQGSAWLQNTDWKYVSTTYTATTGVSSIDFNVLAWQLPAGKSLLVSDPSLVELNPVGSSSSASSSSASSPTGSPSAPVSIVHTPNPSSSAPAPSSSTPAPPPPSSSTPAPPPPTSSAPAPTGYHLVWSDDFNSINTSKWNVRNNSWAHNEESIDTSRPQNVFINNGALTLRAINETYTVNGTTRQYTSGYLDTIGKESWQYGRIEMRAKLPTAQGMWPAFWLRDDSGLGELDIMEAVGGLNTKTVQTVHQSTNGDMAKAGHENTLASGSNADWHVYAVDREPGFMKWYIDDKLVFSVTSTQYSWLESAFASPMNIRLNLQVGGSMPAYYQKPVMGAPLGASDYTIDYVRVYQK